MSQGLKIKCLGCPFKTKIPFLLYTENISQMFNIFVMIFWMTDLDDKLDSR